MLFNFIWLAFAFAFAEEPHSQLVDIGDGRKIYLECQGTGSPTVVLVSGRSDRASIWKPVISEVAKFTKVCAYDRPGTISIIDNNKVQAKGFVAQDMSIEPLADKLDAFNLEPWETNNGHDVAELIDLFTTLHTQRRGKPNAVILNTIKGKNIGMCELNPNWHTSAPREVSMAQDWLMEFWERDGRRLDVPEEFPRRLGEAITIVPPVHDNPDQIVEKQA